MDIPSPSAARSRLKAATLLESVLALGILAAATSTAVVIHQRTLLTSRAYARMAAWSATERMLQGASANTASVDGAPDPEIALQVVPLGNGVEEVRITCVRDGRTLLERRVLRPAP